MRFVVVFVAVDDKFTAIEAIVEVLGVEEGADLVSRRVSFRLEELHVLARRLELSLLSLDGILMQAFQLQLKAGLLQVRVVLLHDFNRILGWLLATISRKAAKTASRAIAHTAPTCCSEVGSALVAAHEETFGLAGRPKFILQLVLMLAKLKGSCENFWFGIAYRVLSSCLIND